MRYVLALDQGTTSSRSILFDEHGATVAVAQRELPQIYPRPGWVEHDPAAIWSTQLATALEVVERAAVARDDIVAIGITNQRETTVIWDRQTGEPVANAIVWQDRRTSAKMSALRDAGHEASVVGRTGLRLDPYFSASKLGWLLDQDPDLRARAAAGELAFGTVDSWLAFKLTQGALHITDPSNASRTLLYDLHTNEWSDDLLSLFDVPRALLPEVRSSSEVYGAVSIPGPLAGIPIAGIAGDQQAALAGQLCTSPGMTKSTYGTGCFLLANTGDAPIASRNRLLTTVGWRVGDQLRYALEGSVFIGGAVVQWLRDGLGIIRASDEVEELARSVDDNGGVVVVPAFTGLGAPHWDADARGTICGLTRGSTAAHIARAALESIALQVADVVDAMRADSGFALDELRVDGGATANDTLMQLQADILQAPVVRPRVTETTALGAAYLAGLGVALWSGFDQLESNREIDRRFEPSMAADRAASLRRDWSEAVRRSLGWANRS